MPGLSVGDLCAQRFRIEGVAGAGGMGTVFRALDTYSGETVGLKILHRISLSGDEANRFQREASILAGLRHPGIARYVDHGLLPDGKAYLAMEWLEGETLAQRLAGPGLSLGESLHFLRAIAVALAAAHGQGFVHRDIKPSNLFLRSGDVDRVAVLDFGLARSGRASQAVTNTGMVVGTPEYMAPEQARGQNKLTAAADIFSLGVVWFECLTGAPPFVGEHVAAVLAKVLFEPLPDVRTLRPAIPAAVAQLLSTMLARTESQRPPDAQALLSQLELILRAGLPELAPPQRRGSRERSRRQAEETGRAAGSVGSSEQGLVCVLLCRWDGDATGPDRGPTDGDPSQRSALERLTSRLTALGVQVVPLADSTRVLSFFGGWGSATDQVGQAARCALLVREHLPQARMVIATGRGALSHQIPIGEALERAAAMLETPRPSSDASIWLDDLTAGLLDSRFHVVRSGDQGPRLERANLDADTTRLLLGQPTPCVGREHELTALDSLLDGVIDEHCPRAVIVTAAAGIGKSRLRHEFLHRIGSRREPVHVLVGRCDPLSMGVPLFALADMVRKHFGLQGGDDPERARIQLKERLAALPGVAVSLECELIGELISLPFPDDGLPLLAAARQDGQLFRSLLLRALASWLQRLCAQAPVLMVFEDLHWSDVLSVTLLEDLLRSLKEAPLAILALARPEALERFPKLWSAHAQVIPLRPLSRRASERLIVQVLGPRGTPELVAEIVDRAEGNALFLEELIRHSAERSEGQRPETMLALLQARISRLDGPSRRILRMASLFGESFSLAGVSALLDGKLASTELSSWLAVLGRQELLQERVSRALHPEPGASSDSGYRFRHALLRDAAYELLSPDERQAGHRAAAAFLEQSGGATDIVLAEHLLRSAEPRAALPYLKRAADSAWSQASPSESLRLVEKALAAGAEGRVRGEFLAIRACASIYSEDNAAALASAEEARQYLAPGSRYWYLSLNTSTVAAGLTGDIGTLMRAVQLFEGVEPTAEVAVGFGEAAGVVGSMYATMGQRQPLERLVVRCRDYIDRHGASTLPLRGLAPLLIPAYFLHRFFLPQPFSALSSMAQSLEYVERAGELDMPPIFVGAYSKALMDVGRFSEAAERIDRLRAVTHERHDRWGETLLAFYAIGGPAWPIEPTQLAQLESWIAVVQGNPKAPLLFQGIALSAAAHVQLRRGEPARAQALAQASLDSLHMMATRSAAARVVLSQAQLALGNAAAACQVAEAGLALLAQARAQGGDELPLRLCRLQALQVLGAHDELAAEARRAHAALWLRHADAPSPAAWQQYLALPCHVELLALCERVLGQPSQ